MKVLPYLHFPGTAEAVLEFYKAAGLGEITNLSRYADMPPGEHAHPMPPEKVMHARITGPDGDILMASDSAQASGIHGIALSIALSDLPRAQALFAALSDGGMVTMPMAATFWGATFGMFTDKFGVHWMINCEATA